MRSSRPPLRVLVVLALVSAVAGAGLAGCGGSSAPSTTTTTTDPTPGNATGLSYKHDRSRVAQGVEGSSVCTILPVGRVERAVGTSGLRTERNDSLDLSICRYTRGAVNVRVVLDGAADATRRFANLLAEAAQRFNAIPGLRPRDVAHVGEDDDYGGTGAYWTRDRDQLIAYSADRIVRVTVQIPGRSDAGRRAMAAGLARAVFAAMPRERDG